MNLPINMLYHSGRIVALLRRESKGFLPFFLVFTVIQTLVSAQTEGPGSSISILFMTFSGANTAEAVQLGEAMRSELEWISRESGYTIKQSTSTLRAPPAMNRLSSADQAQNPKYLINGVITREGGVTVAEISLWNLEGPAMLFSQAFEYRRLDEAMAMMPFFTWSLYAVLPVPETSADELNAAREDAKTARAEAAIARADARAARIETAAAKAEAEAAKAEAATAKAALGNSGDTAAITDNAATKAWKSRWLYLGFRGGISPRVYNFEANFPKELGFTWEAALQTEFQFFRFPWGRRSVFLGLQGEAILSVDKFNLAGTDGSVLEQDFFSLAAPLLLKLNYKPGPFALSLYGGMYYIWHLPFNTSGGGTVQAAMRKSEGFSLFDSLGYSAGFKFGVKAGKQGAIFFDLRYSSDIGVTKIESAVPVSYRRDLPSVSLGYEAGFFNRK
jgi:hypothetical protein